ncbi:MAG: addiction module protein [Flavobacteriales bacterium]|nr:addiction module protein [Flavobacteriales bacterium]
MDTRALKLELLERLAAVNDEAKLVEVKHVLDGTDAFELSDAELNLVNERFEAYKRGEAKTYTWEEVQRMLEENRRKEQR